MMKANIKRTLLSSAIAVSTITASTMLTSTAFAGASVNVGVTNNYIWRGVTQTDDAAAVSGGLDYDFGNGFSVGTWTSNVDFPGAAPKDKGYELDFYGGYGAKAGPMDYSVGFTHYAYPSHDDIDFTEVNGSLGYGPITLGVAYTAAADNDAAEGDMYYSLSGSTDIKPGLSLGATVGNYDFDAGDDYTHYQISLSKSDFTFAVDDNDIDGSDPQVTISWSKSLDL